MKNLSKKLQREGLTAQYDAIIQEQLTEGVIEKAPPVSQPEKEFYIPHKSVICESAETTKLRIVYDASARATPDAPSLNDCLYPGPALQNKLWDVLIQQRAYPVVLGDIKKAFLQICIHKSERDALRFHWPENPATEKTKTPEEEAKIIKEVLSLAKDPGKEEKNSFDILLERHDLRKALRI